MRRLILSTIDFFYPAFKFLMPLQTFRYAACGGFNMLLDISLFFISIHYIFTTEVVHVGFLALKQHNAAFLSSFCVTFPVGFYFSRYVVFSQSNIRGRVQLLRYFMLVLACIGLNYMFLNFFVEQLHIFPTVAKIFTTILVMGFSFFTQKHFTFKTKKERGSEAASLPSAD